MSEFEARQQQLQGMEQRSAGISGSVHAELLRMQEAAASRKSTVAMDQVLKTYDKRRLS